MLEDKLAEDAAEHVEPGEEVRALVRVRKGTIHQQNHALIATDRNVYAFRLKWPGQTNIAEQLDKLALADARLEFDRRKVVLHNRRSGESTEWKRLRLEDPADLARYLEQGDAQG